MIVNGHSDIIVDIVDKIKSGEKDIFYKYHYENFIKSKVKTVILVFWIEPYYEDISARLEEILVCLKKELGTSKVINHCKSYKDLLNDGDKINVIFSFEGLEHLGDKLELIESYKKDLGIFYSSLTWNEKNLLSSGPGHSGGLTELGIKAVEELEKNNIVVDTSHTNEETFWDIIKYSKKPIIASHSNARNLCDVKRNLTDDQIRAIADKNGLIGINAYADFTSKDKSKRNIDGLIDHIDYIRELTSIDNLTFGFDFCDFLPKAYVGDSEESTTVDGLTSEEDVVKLIERMRERSYTEDEIEKISYKNYYRFFEKYFND